MSSPDVRTARWKRVHGKNERFLSTPTQRPPSILLKRRAKRSRVLQDFEAWMETAIDAMSDVSLSAVSFRSVRRERSLSTQSFRGVPINAPLSYVLTLYAPTECAAQMWTATVATIDATIQKHARRLTSIVAFARRSILTTMVAWTCVRSPHVVLTPRCYRRVRWSDLRTLSTPPETVHVTFVFQTRARRVPPVTAREAQISTAIAARTPVRRSPADFYSISVAIRVGDPQSDTSRMYVVKRQTRTSVIVCNQWRIIHTRKI